jgi:hypothetical protein
MVIGCMIFRVTSGACVNHQRKTIVLMLMCSNGQFLSFQGISNFKAPTNGNDSYNTHMCMWNSISVSIVV